MALFLSIFPIVLLIWLMVKKNSMPSYIALPLVAALIYVIKIAYFGDKFMLLNATVASGLVSTLTPITVIFGAIMFNRMMETTGCIDVIRKWLATISPNPVAQLMIIGWSFAFMIEGASGFGTPAAIAAPILMSLGFNPLKVAIFTLVMNSVPVSFGAVGTPTWFGFAPLNLSPEDILSIGRQTGIMHFAAGLIVPVIGLCFIVPWEEVKKNLGFVAIAVFSCTIPYVLLAQVNEEFPSLVAGAIGLGVSVFAANKGWGLSKDHQKDKNLEKVPLGQVLKALAPLGMLIGMLVVTRIKQLGLKAILTSTTPWFSFSLPGLSDITVTQSLTIVFANIFGEAVSEKYQTLYVPAWIPFVFTVWICIVLYKTKFKDAWAFYVATIHQTNKPLLALMGALIMVKLMMVGGDASMVKIIGKEFAAMAGDNWIYFSPYLGAIGAFFSGSNTVSNLTFGAIQQQIATDTGLSVTLILALQSVGGAMGNMICINNIIAVCTVLNVENSEGAIIKKTIIPMTIYGVIAVTIALIFFA
ncbi:L-lactate permease [Kingella negevensis]|uniref:L-lactate permease n=1 Tax=Kingella negevensis TaxID=1522312 RepID=A0A238HGC8_9NEIS|nr:L-lactate permease [Kingella negevensis]MDK4684791.1 L-lactate permease [Kingella negevensis]MDK4688682.1 L-lactate permease [Kingella negevensis]MDK4696646.1 L-lactate permease [Kingella negevensis]MDK4707332.1 L-lactate permease [Kingella negevensis]MDK4710190.1 L-lactate permease [Kingella negevensis]